MNVCKTTTLAVVLGLATPVGTAEEQCGVEYITITQAKTVTMMACMVGLGANLGLRQEDSDDPEYQAQVIETFSPVCQELANMYLSGEPLADLRNVTDWDWQDLVQ